MKLRPNRHIILLCLFFAAGLAIRFYQLSFFEFKNDQLDAISLGHAARQACFLITHGMPSGVGINNPQLFIQVMGILTWFTEDPFLLTLCFLLVNLAAMAIAMRYFYHYLEPVHALAAGVLLALLPAYIIYSNNIWAQCLLPLPMILFNLCLCRFIKYRLSRDFFFCCMCVILACGLHMSGFFILPALAIVFYVYRKAIDKRVLMAAACAGLFLFVPYFFHLFFEGELKRFISYAVSPDRDFPWKAIVMHLRMSSFEFFRSYFRYDFNAVLKEAACHAGWPLYAFALALPGFFIFGFYNYLSWLFKGRRLFAQSPDSGGAMPIPVQISGFLVIVLTAGFMFCRVRTPAHYFIILFPAHAVIAGFAVSRLWHKSWGRVLAAAGISSTLILLVFTLVFLQRAGGHYYAYGISYKKMLQWRQEIISASPPGHYLDLDIHFIGKGKDDRQTAYALLGADAGSKKLKRPLPADLDIYWNDSPMRYEYALRVKQ
ncbi:MAG: hypothetical protein PHV77_00155 [Candidatus Omnitrophica bacterium]|nr:hypothetical protein [Candidatus Omnitrophota bacterium]